MEILSHDLLAELPEFNGHEAVYRLYDPSVGLHGFVAIHNRNLGPAVGGTRMFPYVSEKEALRDVLRLSRAMTYKCALAGVPYGGGKAVLIGDPSISKNEELIRVYAREIGTQRGAFYTGEDVGISEADVQVMLEEAPFFIGRSGRAGDPSPFASLSCFYSIQVAVSERLCVDSLSGLSVAVKGVGKVGGELVRLLSEAGTQLIIADMNQHTLERLVQKHPQVRVVSPNEIHVQSVDVYAPCALGNEFTLENCDDAKARIICGGANNQLQSLEVGDHLFERGIFYVPDYIANAGGLINVVDELEVGGYQRARVIERVQHIKDTVYRVITLSKQEHQGTHRVADRLAEEIFEKPH